jgi:hypothetical protein
METTNTNISPWLHSVQHTFRTQALFPKLMDSNDRIRNTKEKINSLLNKMYELESLQKSDLFHYWYPKYGDRITPSYHESDMIAIRDAIGVYRIYDPNHRSRVETNTLWEGYEDRYKTTLGRSNGRFIMNNVIVSKKRSEWLDYFGEDYGITKVGGYITVSLSDHGISYLNSIWEGVSSLYDSYTNTPVNT